MADVLQLEAGEEGQDAGEVQEVVAEALPFVHDVAAVLGFEAGGVVVAEVAGGEDDADDFFGAAAVGARVDREVFHREGEVFHADAGDSSKLSPFSHVTDGEPREGEDDGLGRHHWHET